MHYFFNCLHLNTTVNYFNFLDNGIELQIMTNCSPYSQSKEDQPPSAWKHILGNGTHFNVIEKSFRFCNSPTECCLTGSLPVQNQRCKQTNYKAYELGGCGRFDFDFEKLDWTRFADIALKGPKKGREGFLRLYDITKLNAWTPEWIKLVLKNGDVIKCSFNRIMTCEPEGKISFVVGFDFNLYRISSYGFLP